MTTPGCLPLTTPENISLDDLESSKYTIMDPSPEEEEQYQTRDDDLDIGQPVGSSQPTGRYIDELFEQYKLLRIAQGFQVGFRIIILSKFLFVFFLNLSF